MFMATSSSSKKELVQISSYSRRLKDSIKAILDNYGEILKAAKVKKKFICNNYGQVLFFLNG